VNRVRQAGSRTHFIAKRTHPRVNLSLPERTLTVQIISPAQPESRALQEQIAAGTDSSSKHNLQELQQTRHETSFTRE
jgi:hypothetical protein